jgi:hypothetical protein
VCFFLSFVLIAYIMKSSRVFDQFFLLFKYVHIIHLMINERKYLIVFFVFETEKVSLTRILVTREKMMHNALHISFLLMGDNIYQRVFFILSHGPVPPHSRHTFVFVFQDCIYNPYTYSK